MISGKTSAISMGLESGAGVKGSGAEVGNVGGAGNSKAPEGPSFKEKFDSFVGREQFNEIQGLQKALESGKTIPARELLVYQVQLSALNQRVELLSKLGESAMGTVRKFQQQQ